MDEPATHVPLPKDSAYPGHHCHRLTWILLKLIRITWRWWIFPHVILLQFFAIYSLGTEKYHQHGVLSQSCSERKTQSDYQALHVKTKCRGWTPGAPKQTSSSIRRFRHLLESSSRLKQRINYFTEQGNIFFLSHEALFPNTIKFRPSRFIDKSMIFPLVFKSALNQNLRFSASVSKAPAQYT